VLPFSCRETGGPAGPGIGLNDSGLNGSGLNGSGLDGS